MSLVFAQAVASWSLIFDGDGTLWPCSPYYIEAGQRCADLLREVLTVPLETAEDLHRRIQRALIERHGPYRLVFADSWVETYRHICQRRGIDADAEIIDRIRDLANAVFAAPYPLFDGVIETLIMLRQRGCRLHLLTRGDTEWQMSKVRRNALEGYFDTIHPTLATKGPTMRLLAREGRRAAMIGDNPDDDHKPARALGLIRILIENPDPWVRHGRPIDPGTHIMPSITHVPELLDRFDAGLDRAL